MFDNLEHGIRFYSDRSQENDRVESVRDLIGRRTKFYGDTRMNRIALLMATALVAINPAVVALVAKRERSGV